MTTHLDPTDPRHRPVVWASGDPLGSAQASFGRRIGARIGYGLGGAAMVTALFMGVSLWSPSAVGTTTPARSLWVAPGDAESAPRPKERATTGDPGAATTPAGQDVPAGPAGA